MIGAVFSFTFDTDLYEANRIVDEAIQKGLHVERFYWEKWEINSSGNETQFIHDGELIDFSKFGWAYLRPPHSEKKGLYFLALKSAVLRELSKNKARVLNGESLNKVENLYKTTQQIILKEKGIPTIDTYYSSLLDTRKIPFSFPVVTKKVLGGKSLGVYKVDSGSELNNIVKHEPREVIHQPWIPIKQDYRILVLNGRVLGAMERRLKEDSKTKRISVKATKSEKIIDSNTIKIAKKVTKAFKLDICGVDILIHNNSPLVIEANRYPQFKRFEEAIGVNVAEKIIDFLVSSK